MESENIHRAVFTRPTQGPLNPLGVTIDAPVTVEVFQPTGSKKWQAREATTKRIIKQAGAHQTHQAARWALAALFDAQSEPWALNGQPDPTARMSHLHSIAEAPSLCGSRYHVTVNPALLLFMPYIRRGDAKVPDKAQICPNCAAMFDRTPQPGDRVGKLSGEKGRVISADRVGVVIEWDSGERTTQHPAEVRPLFLEQFR